MEVVGVILMLLHAKGPMNYSALVADWKDCTIAEENFSLSTTLVSVLLNVIKYTFFTLLLDSIKEFSLHSELDIVFIIVISCVSQYEEPHNFEY